MYQSNFTLRSPNITNHKSSFNNSPNIRNTGAVSRSRNNNQISSLMPIPKKVSNWPHTNMRQINQNMGNFKAYSNDNSILQQHLSVTPQPNLNGSFSMNQSVQYDLDSSNVDFNLQTVIKPNQSNFIPNESNLSPNKSNFNAIQPALNPNHYFNPNQSTFNPNQSNFNQNQPTSNPNQLNLNRSSFNTNQSAFNPNQSSFNRRSVMSPNQSGLHRNQPVFKTNQSGLNPNQSGLNPNQSGLNPNQFVLNPIPAVLNPIKPVLNPNQSFYNSNQSVLNPNQSFAVPNQSVLKQNQSAFSANNQQLQIIENMGNVALNHSTNQNKNNFNDSRIMNKPKPMENIGKSEERATNNIIPVYGNSIKESMFIYTGTAERLIKWRRIFQNNYCYFVVIAQVISVNEGNVRMQKILILRDKIKGPILQVVYYTEGTRINIENFHIGQMLRCVGYMIGPNILSALSIRAATEDEVSTLERFCLICDHAVRLFIQ